MFVCCECCVLSDRCLCDELITRPEESYRLWCVVACDQETSPRMRRPLPALGGSAIGKKYNTVLYCIVLMSIVPSHSLIYSLLVRTRKSIVYKYAVNERYYHR